MQQQLTHRGRPVQFIEIPRVGRILPSPRQSHPEANMFAWAVVIDHNGVEREVPLDELKVQVAA